jgi:lipopolysaccharide export system protein LptA
MQHTETRASMGGPATIWVAARWGAAAALLGAGGWLVWYVVAGPGAAPLSAPAAQVVDAPAFEAEGNTFVLWGERGGRGIKQCQVTARRFRLSADKRYRYLDGITDAVFYEQTRPVVRAVAGRAVQDEFRKQLDVAGGVRVSLPDGRAAVASETAHWNGSTRRLTFPEALVLTAPNARFRAARANLDLGERLIHLRDLDGETGGARIASARCDYHLKSAVLLLEPLEYREPAVQLHLGTAELNTRTRSFTGKQVTMKATIHDFQPARAGGRLLASAALAALASASAHPGAGAPSAPAPAEKKPEAKTSEIQITGNKIFKDEAGKRMLLEGNVIITQKDTVFRADRIEISLVDGEPRVAVATENPRANDPRNSVTGEKFTIYLKERRVVVEGNTKVVTRPKEKEPAATPAADDKSIRSQLKGETVITANHLEYDYRRKNLVAEGALKFVNKGRTLTADRITYSDKTEDAVLYGDPIHWVDEKGQQFDTAGPIEMNLKEGAETLKISKPFKGKFLIKEDEEDEKETTPPAQSAKADGQK